MAKSIRAATLFHFTSNLDALKEILSNGFRPRFCLEDFRWFFEAEEPCFRTVPMVSFCNIPLTRIDEHVQFYGKFGIGLTQKWATESGLNPVLYLPHKSAIAKRLTFATRFSISKIHDEDVKEADSEKKTDSEDNFSGDPREAFKSMLNILSIVKPMHGSMKKRGKMVNKSFYEESEWRYILHKESLAETILKNQEEIDDYDEEEINNEIVKEDHLRFHPDDIKYILVDREDSISDVFHFINVEMGQYSADSIKRLSTRIISLEFLSADF